MPIERDKCPKIVTPVGTAVFPRVNTPDFKFKKEGEYSVKLRLSGAAAAQLKAQIMEFYEQAYLVECEDKGVQPTGPKALKRADPPFKQATTKDGEEIADTFDFTCKRKASGETKAGKKWQARPALVDAKGAPMKAEVWGGSQVRCSVQLVPWYAPSFGFGVKPNLFGVQVIDLVTKGGEMSAAALGFDAVEGYSSSNEDAPEAPEGDTDGATSPSLAEF
jgi:hypothetical protein